MTSNALDPTLSDPQSVNLATRSGRVITVRPVTDSDTHEVEQFFNRLSPEDMHFRFLSGQHRLSHHQLAALVGVDHRHSEHLLAFDKVSGELIGSLLIAADQHMEVAEVAIAVAPEHKRQGLGWTLLKHAAELARQRGVRRLRSIESKANHQAIEVERALGFSASEYPDDARLVLVEAKLD